MTDYERAEYEFLRIMKKMPGDGQFFHFDRSPDTYDSVANLTMDVVTWAEFTDVELLKNIEGNTLDKLVLARLEYVCDAMTDTVSELKQTIKGIKDGTKSKT